MGNNQGNTKKNRQDGNKSTGKHDANSSGTPASSPVPGDTKKGAQGSDAKTSSKK